MVQPAQGLSNAEISEAPFITEATAKTYVGHILNKLGLCVRMMAKQVA